MALERTFSILKPDASRRNLTGAVNAMIEGVGLRIIAQKRIHMTRAQAETFYGVHAARPFFGELVDFMTSAPVVVQVLEGENAIAATAKSWALPILPMLMKARSVRLMLNQLGKIPSTVLMLLIRLLWKSLSSSRAMKLSAKARMPY